MSKKERLIKEKLEKELNDLQSFGEATISVYAKNFAVAELHGKNFCLGKSRKCIVYQCKIGNYTNCLNYRGKNEQNSIGIQVKQINETSKGIIKGYS